MIKTLPGQAVYEAVTPDTDQGTILVAASCVAEAIYLLHRSPLSAGIRLMGVRRLSR